MLVGENLSLHLPTDRALFERVNLSVSQGEICLIQGRNGQGKTSLLKGLMYGHPFIQGDVRRNFKKYSYLPQISNLRFSIPLSLKDILELDKTQSSEVAQRLINCGLLSKSHLDLKWNTASGGERQRCLILKSLISQPQVLFLDEPTNHLDKASIVKISVILKSFTQGEWGEPGSVVMISHDPSFLKPLDSKNVLDLDSYANPERGRL